MRRLPSLFDMIILDQRAEAPSEPPHLTQGCHTHLSLLSGSDPFRLRGAAGVRADEHPAGGNRPIPPRTADGAPRHPGHSADIPDIPDT